VLDIRRDKLMAAYIALAENEDPLAHLALEPVSKLDRDRAAQDEAIRHAEAVISEWAGPPVLDAAINFYSDLLDAIHGRIAQAAGVRELNQALSTVVAGLWAESDGGRLLIEFELMHPTATLFLNSGPARLGRVRPTLPPRHLDDVHTEQPPAFTFVWPCACQP